MIVQNKVMSLPTYLMIGCNVVHRFGLSIFTLSHDKHDHNNDNKNDNTLNPHVFHASSVSVLKGHNDNIQ